MPPRASEIKRRIDALGQKKIGQRIAAARLLRGYKQRELDDHPDLRADELTTRVVGDVERGDRKLDPKGLLAIARALDVNVSFFIDDDPFAGDGDGSADGELLQTVRNLAGRLDAVQRSLDRFSDERLQEMLTDAVNSGIDPEVVAGITFTLGRIDTHLQSLAAGDAATVMRLRSLGAPDPPPALAADDAVLKWIQTTAQVLATQAGPEERPEREAQ